MLGICSCHPIAFCWCLTLAAINCAIPCTEHIEEKTQASTLLGAHPRLDTSSHKVCFSKEEQE
jgi:hypothetical protein